MIDHTTLDAAILAALAAGGPKRLGVLYTDDAIRTAANVIAQPLREHGIRALDRRLAMLSGTRTVQLTPEGWTLPPEPATA